MEIVFITDHLVRGGAETQLIRIATTLRRRGWKVGIITMLPFQEFTEDLKDANIPLFECSTGLPWLPNVPFLMAFLMAVRMIRRLLSWQPHVVVTFSYHGDIMGRVCARIAGVKAVVASLRTAYIKTPLRELLYRRTECLIRLTASNSQAAIDYMLERNILTPEKTLVIPNGIHTSSFPHDIPRNEARLEFAFSPDAFIWLAVGNLRPAKDYPTLLDAAERCCEARSEFRLLIAGEGEELANLEADAQRRGLAGKIVFLGSRPDIPRLLRACDAYVLSSAWEGMPNTVMEAMASAVPVVCTNAGGVQELFETGTCGYIVPTRDPAALAERMIHLMDMDEHQRLQMGARGRERIAGHFDNERVVDRWEGMIRQVILP